VAYQALTGQIKGFIEVDKKTEKTFTLVVTQATTLSAPLVKAVKEVGGTIVRVGEGVGRQIQSTPMIAPTKWLQDGMKRFGGGDGAT
jgi:hypothetical protein